MILSIHQPSYFPWLGLLDKIAKSDEFIILDNVQLADRAYQHRNLFLTLSGKEKFLTISLKKKSYRYKKIREIVVCDNNWQEKHINFLRNNYHNTPFYNEIMEAISPYFRQKKIFLIDNVLDSMKIILNLLDIKTKILMQSEVLGDTEFKKNDLILELAKKVNADIYLSGTGAESYLSLESFKKENIQVVFNNFTHPSYKQVNSIKGFVYGLSSLDLLFNLGIKGSQQFFYDNLNS